MREPDFQRPLYICSQTHTVSTIKRPVQWSRLHCRRYICFELVLNLLLQGFSARARPCIKRRKCLRLGGMYEGNRTRCPILYILPGPYFSTRTCKGLSFDCSLWLRYFFGYLFCGIKLFIIFLVTNVGNVVGDFDSYIF